MTAKMETEEEKNPSLNQKTWFSYDLRLSGLDLIDKTRLHPPNKVSGDQAGSIDLSSARLSDGSPHCKIYSLL